MIYHITTLTLTDGSEVEYPGFPKLTRMGNYVIICNNNVVGWHGHDEVLSVTTVARNVVPV